MAPKISSETQKLHCLKEELMLKRKMCERAELVDKEFLEHSNKMAKTMESVASTMSGCFQLMTSMFQAQMQQRNFSFGNVHQPPVMPCKIVVATSRIGQEIKMELHHSQETHFQQAVHIQSKMMNHI